MEKLKLKKKRVFSYTPNGRACIHAYIDEYNGYLPDEVAMMEAAFGPMYRSMKQGIDDFGRNADALGNTISNAASHVTQGLGMGTVASIVSGAIQGAKLAPVKTHPGVVAGWTVAGAASGFVQDRITACGQCHLGPGDPNEKKK